MTRPLVIGGGLSGAALAIRLAGQGMRPILIERSTVSHHKVCGEFLSGEAVEELESLGVKPAALGASAITHVRLVHYERVAHAALPFPALGLSRAVLDEALLARAAEAGVEVRRGERVTEPGPAPAGGLFLAAGKTALRGVERGPASGLTGFKMHFRASKAAKTTLAGVVELILTGEGYAGLQLVEGGIANLCLVTRSPEADALGRTIRRTPRLAALLGEAEPLWDRPLAISNLPYGFRAPPVPDGSRLFRLGDQAAMIPSFTGDGMAIALTTARWAAEACAGTSDMDAAARAYARRARAGLRRPVGIADLTARIALLPGLAGPVAAIAAQMPGLLRILARATRVRLVAGSGAEQHAAALSPAA